MDVIKKPDNTFRDMRGDSIQVHAGQAPANQNAQKPAGQPQAEPKRSMAAEMKNRAKAIKNPWRVAEILAFLILLAAGAYYYKQSSDLKGNPQTQANAAQQQVTDLVAKVSRLIVLPEGEQPTIATVSDPAKLADQPFFAHAKAGFKVLIYSQAKKAILYDPYADKIIEVAPLNLNMNPQ